MTTLITRVLPDASVAEKATNKLTMKGLPKRDIQVISAGDNAEALMKRAQVHDSAMARYSDCLAQGNVVMVVRATYKPLGAVRLTRELLDNYDPIETGDAVNEYKLAWAPDKSPSILKDHPLFLSLPDMEPPGRISTSFGVSLLKEHKKKRTLISADRRISRMFWPMPLLSKKKSKRSTIKGGRQMSKLFWPTKLISQKPRRKSVIPGGGFPFSRRLGLKMLS